MKTLTLIPLIALLVLPLVAVAQEVDYVYYSTSAVADKGTLYERVQVNDRFISEYKLEGSGLKGATGVLVDANNQYAQFSLTVRMSDTVVGQYGGWVRRDTYINPNNYQLLRLKVEATGSPTEPDKLKYEENIGIDWANDQFWAYQQARTKGDYIYFYGRTHSEYFGIDWTTVHKIWDGTFSYDFGISGGW